MEEGKVMTRRKRMVLLMLLALTVAALCTPASAAKKKKVLVAYFSATGTTKAAAKKVSKAAGGKLYRIRPKKAYTSADLDYDNDNCRATREQRSESARPAVKGKVKKIRKYDIIFVGYPIWWGKEPKVIKTFLESYNLKGKTVIPFCTSGGSGISGSMKGIRKSAAGAKVLAGKDLTDLSYKKVLKWVRKVLKKA